MRVCVVCVCARARACVCPCARARVVLRVFWKTSDRNGFSKPRNVAPTRSTVTTRSQLSLAGWASQLATYDTASTIPYYYYYYYYYYRSISLHSAPFRSPPSRSGVRGRSELVILPLPHICLLYTSPSPRDVHKSRMPSSA